MQTVRKLDFDTLYKDTIRPFFKQIPDLRGSNKKYKLSDILSAAYAVFSLKMPSLLRFEQRPEQESENVLRVFDLERIPSDSQARTVIDTIDTEKLHDLFPALFRKAEKANALKPY